VFGWLFKKKCGLVMMERRGVRPKVIIRVSFNLQISPVLSAFLWFTVNYLPVLSVAFVPFCAGLLVNKTQS
jgi:hypothetical protein